APAQLMKVLPAADGLPARVRAEPNVRAPILIRVPLGATVEVLGTANGEELQPGNPRWVRIKWRGTTGYVYSALVGNP
ncbi:MAG TPA: SH3 domain-containing protein, partial [Chloroflexota bacterium]